MKEFEEMNIWEVAGVIHGCVSEHLLYFIDKEGMEIPLQIKSVTFGKILLENELGKIFISKDY